MIEENNHKEEIDKQTWWQPAVVFFTKASSWIAGPIIIALFLGKYLDQRYHTKPKLFIICIIVAFISSCVGLGKDISKYLKEMDLPNDKNQKLKEKK